jgi:hypothetical protein
MADSVSWGKEKCCFIKRIVDCPATGGSSGRFIVQRKALAGRPQTRDISEAGFADAVCDGAVRRKAKTAGTPKARMQGIDHIETTVFPQPIPHHRGDLPQVNALFSPAPDWIHPPVSPKINPTISESIPLLLSLLSGL